MLDVSLSKVTRPLLRDEAYDRIRHAIVDGTLPPGTPLRDGDLADQLGLSKAPVREALRRLAEDGLVDSKPQSYTRVSDVMSRDVIDARQIVRAAARVRRAGRPRRDAARADVAAMRAANDRFAKAIEAGDIAAAVKADDELHDVPVRLAGNAAVAATLDRYTPLLRRLEHARFSSTLAWNSVERHTTLIDALEAARHRHRRLRDLDHLDRPPGGPMTLADFPRFPLLFGPSPVHPLERLTAHLGGAKSGPSAKTSTPGLAYGGNKTRKLEYLVADALNEGADTLVSIGGVQSNHTRQVAAAAARAGLKAVLVQESWVDWPDPLYDKVGNIQLSRILGADVRLVDAGFGIGFKQAWEDAVAEIEADGGKPYAIPAGASDHRLGGLGFANWVVELEEQEEELGVFFDTVIVCSVTGSTQGGMVAGTALGKKPGASSASTPPRSPKRPASRSRASRATPPS